MTLGRDDAVALTYSGFALGRVLGEYDDGIALLDRALELDPHLAAGWHFGGALRAFKGESDEAIARLDRAMRLSPRDPRLDVMMAAIGYAHFAAGRYDEAVKWSERSIRENGTFLPPYRQAALSHALAGRIDEARRAIARVLAVDPDCRLNNVRGSLPQLRADLVAKQLEGLRLAGLPE